MTERITPEAEWLWVGANPPYSVTYIDPKVTGSGEGEQWFVMGTVDGNPRNPQGPVAICDYEPAALAIAALLNATIDGYVEGPAMTTPDPITPSLCPHLVSTAPGFYCSACAAGADPITPERVTPANHEHGTGGSASCLTCHPARVSLQKHPATPESATVAGFVFCDVRWTTPDKRGEHVCAEHRPGHEVHRCCCEAVKETP